MSSRVWASFSAVVLVAAVVLLWFGFSRRPGLGPQQTLKPEVSLATVRQGSVEETISVNGRIGSPAGTQAKLAFAVAGAVQSVDVSLGERVSEGAPLAHLDPTSYSLVAAQAQSEAGAAERGAALAAIDRTSVTVHRDEVELARQQRLFEAGIVAKRDVEAARATLWSDRAQAQTAHISLAQAQDQSRAASLHAADTRYDVDRTTLRAPSPGTVTGIFVTRGESVRPHDGRDRDLFRWPAERDARSTGRRSRPHRTGEPRSRALGQRYLAGPHCGRRTGRRSRDRLRGRERRRRSKLVAGRRTYGCRGSRPLVTRLRGAARRRHRGSANGQRTRLRS